MPRKLKLKRSKSCLYIRWIMDRDMPEVLEIENRSFEFPWLEEDFIGCLHQRNCVGMVAKHDGRVVGFMIYFLEANRIELDNLAVDPEYRRRGVGAHMVQKLIDKLSSQRRRRLVVKVRERNLDGHLFFRRVGLRVTAVLRGFFEETGEDAYRFEYRVKDERSVTV